MAREDFPKSRELNDQTLIDQIRESNRRGERFCFILGSGASKESGIPTGGELEMRWMNCIMGVEADKGTPPMDPKDARERADKLKEDGLMKYSFSKLVDAWKQARKEGWRTLDPKYYFDLYTLRFYPEAANGYHYMEDLMEGLRPSIGYRVLTRLLVENGNQENESQKCKECQEQQECKKHQECEKRQKHQKFQNNLVITTNFDSLIEDALFLYGEKKPLSVDHEALADFFSLNIQRPIVVRIHRGLLLHPFNTQKETDHLSKEWEAVLNSALSCYTPIVLGYGGGDGSLMSYLEQCPNLRKLYWCWRPSSDEDWVDERVEKLLWDEKRPEEKANRFLVKIRGFDALLVKLGGQLFPDDVNPTETVKLLENRCKAWTDNYQRQYEAVKDNPETKDAAAPVKQSEERQEKIRELQNALSAWDYNRRGNRKCDHGDFKGAIEDYTQAIKRDKDYANAFNNRGFAWDELGEYQKAIDDFNEAIRLTPDDADVFNNRGYTWNNLGEYQKAIDDCTEAIRLKPDYANPFSHRGYAWNKLGEYQKAIDDCTEAIRLNPNYKKAYLNRSNAYLAIGKTDLAQLDEEKAASLPD